MKNTQIIPYPEKPSEFIKESLYRNGESCPFPLSDPVENINDLKPMIDLLDRDRIPWGIRSVKMKTYSGGCYTGNSKGYILFRTRPKFLK